MSGKVYFRVLRQQQSGPVCKLLKLFCAPKLAFSANHHAPTKFNRPTFSTRSSRSSVLTYIFLNKTFWTLRKKDTFYYTRHPSKENLANFCTHRRWEREKGAIFSLLVSHFPNVLLSYMCLFCRYEQSSTLAKGWVKRLLSKKEINGPTSFSTLAEYQYLLWLENFWLLYEILLLLLKCF